MKNSDMIKNYYWNTIAGFLNASEAVVLLLIVTRTNSLGDAGILTIAFAIGNLMMTIGKFGMHNFQVTDVKNKYSYSTYVLSRVITVMLMGVSSIIYIMFGIYRLHYSLEKAVCIFFICIIYMIESIEDVVWCKYQKMGRLDIGAKVFSCRWIAILATMTITLLLKIKMEYALAVATLISGIVEYILITRFNKIIEFNDTKRQNHLSISLMKECIPLFLVSFLNFYLINSPKYAIDLYLSDEVQACYGFVAMPVFVIGLVNGFIYQPMIVKMACEWQSGNLKFLKRKIMNQILIILILTIISEIGAWWIGIPFLSMLYNTNLSAYKLELIILLVSGGNLALIGFFITILTIMRCQKNQLYGYIHITIITFFTVRLAVVRYGTLGAAGIYTLLTFFLVIFFGISIFRKLNDINTRKIQTMV